MCKMNIGTLCLLGLMFLCISSCNDERDPASACAPVTNTNAPGISWMKHFNGSQLESHGHFLHACTDGGFIQLGETGTPPMAKMFVVKIDDQGALLWKTELGNLGIQMANSLIETTNSYVIIGQIDGNSCIVQLDRSSGQTMASNTFELGGQDAFEHAIPYGTGYLAVGYHHAADGLNTFFAEGTGLISLLDAQFNLIESRSIGMYMAHAYRVNRSNDGIYISGLNEDAQDYSLLKLNDSLEVQWHQTYGGPADDHNFGMDIDLQGNIFLTGHSRSSRANWDTYTMKIDPNGLKLWEVWAGNPRGFDPEYIHDEAWDIKCTTDGGCLVVAGTGDEYSNYGAYCATGQWRSDQWAAYLIKIDSVGQIEWQTVFQEASGVDWAGEAVLLTADGGALLAIDNGAFGFLKTDPF